MRMCELFDAPLILDEDGKYYELHFDGYSRDGLNEFPLQCFLVKGEQINKKNIKDYEG